VTAVTVLAKLSFLLRCAALPLCREGVSVAVAPQNKSSKLCPDDYKACESI
jgi:hypothetical protein